MTRSASSKPEKSSIVLLKINDFRLLLSARTLLYMALQIQAVIVGWHIYAISKDPMLLGLIGLAEAIPAILGAFIAGHVVDNSRPAKIFSFSILAIFLNSLLLYLVVNPATSAQMGLQEAIVVYLMFFGVFVSGAARSFTSPSLYAVIPKIVPRSLMASASAFNTSTYQIAAIVGPAIGGLVYGFFGYVTAFLMPVIISFIALLLPMLFSKSVKEYQSNSHREPFIKSITAGLRFSINHRVLFPAMTLDMFSVLFGGAVALLPMFADQVFHLGPSGLGFLRAAPSVGSVIVSLWLVIWPLKKMQGKQLIYVVIGWAVSTILFALTTNFYLALIFLALSGMFDGVSMVIRGTILQIFTPNEMRGRVSAVNSVFITSSNEIGAFESGFAAKLLGLVPSVVFGGVISLVVVAVIYFKYPEFNDTQVDA